MFNRYKTMNETGAHSYFPWDVNISVPGTSNADKSITWRMGMGAGILIHLEKIHERSGTHAPDEYHCFSTSNQCCLQTNATRNQTNFYYSLKLKIISQYQCFLYLYFYYLGPRNANQAENVLVSKVHANYTEMWLPVWIGELNGYNSNRFIFDFLLLFWRSSVWCNYRW